MRFFLAITHLLISIVCFAETSRRDTVRLYNGQILIGEIRQVEGGILTIKDADLSEIKVKLYKIKSMQSPQEFRITTVHKEQYYGYIKPAANGRINIMRSNDSLPVNLGIEEINLMVALENTFLQKLKGSLGLGFSYTKSSDIGQLNFNANLAYAGRSFEHELNASAIGSIDSSKFSRDNENLELLSLYNITPTWFGSVLLTYQRNLELSIARRYQEMIGGGKKLWVRKNLQLSLMSGIAFNQEKNTSGDESKLLIEIPVSLRFNLYQFSHPNIQITTSQTGYISMSQLGRIRFSGTSSFRVELLDDFYFNVNPYTNYDSKPPVEGNKFDFGVTFGLSYTL